MNNKHISNSVTAIDLAENNNIRLKQRKYINSYKINEKEALYEDAMKQKMVANALKEENVRLKTRVHIMEAEITKKERIIEDLIAKPEGGMQNGGQGKKFEGHLTQNLKRRIKEM